MKSCKICKGDTNQIFSKTVLKKYQVNYHQCNTCEFIQTDEPFWLEEAYSNAITNLDIGLLNRNMRMLNAIPKIIDSCFPYAKIMLDYAGGYGVFTRLMRDHGFNFYRQDVYCENTFAKHFDITDIKETNFDVLTAFEVFEHFSNPIVEIEALFRFSDNLIFSTELLPDKKEDIKDWWYISEETGQHIAFYSFKTLQFLAKKWGMQLYSKNKNLHLFTHSKLTNDQEDYAFNDIEHKDYLLRFGRRALSFYVQRDSLLEKDFQLIRSLENK